ELRIVGRETRVHREQFDATHPQVPMSFLQLVLPAWLGGIDRKESDELVRMPAYVSGDITIRHPHSGKFGLPADHDRLVASLACRAVVFPSHREIDLHVTTGALGLSEEVIVEMLRVFEKMAVYVDQEASVSRISSLLSPEAARGTRRRRPTGL